MFSLNYRDNQPIYGQIKHNLKKMIVTGAISPDEQLPSVRSLATTLAINPNTIQRAYSELEAEGFIYSVPGKGSFAAPGRNIRFLPRRQELKQQLRELIAELKYLGMTDSEILQAAEEGIKQ